MGPSCCLTLRTWLSDIGQPVDSGEGRRNNTPPGGAEAAACVCVSGLPGPEVKFWAFLGTTSVLRLLACGLPACFSLILVSVIVPLRIQQGLEGAGKGERASPAEGSSAPAGHSSCWKFWVFLGGSGLSSQRPGRGRHYRPISLPAPASPGPEGPQPPGPLPEPSLQLLPQGAPPPRRVLLGRAQR